MVTHHSQSPNKPRKCNTSFMAKSLVLPSSSSGYFKDSGSGSGCRFDSLVIVLNKRKQQSYSLPSLRVSCVAQLPKYHIQYQNQNPAFYGFLQLRPITSNTRTTPIAILQGPDSSSSKDGDDEKDSKRFLEQWDSMTAKFAGASNVPFLLLQMPQIILNARNLLAGNKTALLAVPWLSLLTGLLGNLSLLSYFVKKREKEAIVVQTLGAVSTYIVFSQLAMAEAMSLPYFLATSVVLATGLVLNFMNYFGFLNAAIWNFWQDFITIGGLSVLPQIMWSTFVPFIPNSILPGAVASLIAISAIIMVRTGRFSEKGIKFVGAVSGWTATLLFMWMPVTQMWTNFLYPENIRGISALSLLLAMMGNGLMIPRALFIRDFMWFTGSTWATLFHGYGNIVWLYCFNVIGKEFFFAATAGLLLWLGLALWRDTVVHGYNSPLTSLKELCFGS